MTFKPEPSGAETPTANQEEQRRLLGGYIRGLSPVDLVCHLQIPRAPRDSSSPSENKNRASIPGAGRARHTVGAIPGPVDGPVGVRLPSQVWVRPGPSGSGLAPFAAPTGRGYVLSVLYALSQGGVSSRAAQDMQLPQRGQGNAGTNRKESEARQWQANPWHPFFCLQNVSRRAGRGPGPQMSCTSVLWAVRSQPRF